VGSVLAVRTVPRVAATARCFDRCPIGLLGVGLADTSRAVRSVSLPYTVDCLIPLCVRLFSLKKRCQLRLLREREHKLDITDALNRPDGAGLIDHHDERVTASGVAKTLDQLMTLWLAFESLRRPQVRPQGFAQRSRHQQLPLRNLSTRSTDN
jgi:hypothetical protein